MGCFLSTSRESAQGTNSSTTEIAERNSGVEQTYPRLVTAQTRPQAAPSHLVISHRTSRRHSRTLEYVTQREAEEQGLRPEERVSQPLIMHIWTSRPQLTREQVMRRREEYYDTRVTGRREIWNVLRLAVETMESGDLATAQEIISASGVTIPTGNLIHGAYDESGTRYELPEYCVSTPRNMILSSSDAEELSRNVGHVTDSEDENDDLEEVEKRRHDKGKRVIHGDEKIYRVIARLSDRGGPDADIPIVFEQGQPVKYIIREILEKGNVASQDYRVKIAYLGRILREHDSLPDQGWIEGHIINALVLQK